VRVWKRYEYTSTDGRTTVGSGRSAGRRLHHFYVRYADFQEFVFGCAAIAEGHIKILQMGLGMHQKRIKAGGVGIGFSRAYKGLPVAPSAVIGEHSKPLQFGYHRLRVRYGAPACYGDGCLAPPPQQMPARGIMDVPFLRRRTGLLVDKHPSTDVLNGFPFCLRADRRYSEGRHTRLQLHKHRVTWTDATKRRGKPTLWHERLLSGQQSGQKVSCALKTARQLVGIVLIELRFIGRICGIEEQLVV